MDGYTGNSCKYKLLTSLVAWLLLSGFTVLAQEKLYHNMFSLKDVRLLEGPFQHARDLNIQTLLKYDVDRLMVGYRKQAGLPAKALSYANWDGLDGHVAGHYLSALSMNYAATGNQECKNRMEYMISELKACQEANGKNNPDWAIGYAGAVPNSAKIWSTFRKGDFSAFRSAWVPWYNVHKMYAGLRDAWLYTGNEEAKNIFLHFCDWGIHITEALTDAQMQTVLDTEHGGMNEIYADAYQITADGKYLAAAKRFSHKLLLDAMAAGKDNLDNKHANTQVPKAVGFERIAEVANDAEYEKAGRFFWETVTRNRTLAFGGNSRREFFPAASACYDFINDVEGPESCNSYNMLKLTEDLFRMHPMAAYMDYYERTVYNHILSTQHPETGGYVYFTPVRPRSYRVYSTPNEGMWCCVGSGMENHGKYNELIYTHSKDSLFLNLFIPSELNWKSKSVHIKQETSFPYKEQTKLTITEGAADFCLLIRYPGWIRDGELKLTVNGTSQPYTAYPSSYIALKRKWKKGDVIKIDLPMHNTVEYLPNTPQYIAIMHGPIVLAAKTGTEDLKGLIADSSRWGHIPGGKKLPINTAPAIIEDNMVSFAGKLEPVAGQPLHFTIPQSSMANPVNMVLQPFNTIHDARYMLYWMALSKAAYQNRIDSIAQTEKQKLALQQRTIDFVAPGEQQPEADHFIEKQNSNTGNYLDEFWRDARNGGYFSYTLNTAKLTGLNLIVRYWGNESGHRKFDIYIDDILLVTENLEGKWNQQQFQDLEYKIPDSVINGKSKIKVKFLAQPGNTAGSVYYIRLARAEK